MKSILVPAAIAALASAAPAYAAPVLSENFGAGLSAFTVQGHTIGSVMPRVYQACCGMTGSDSALDNAAISFGDGNVANEGRLTTQFQTTANILYTLTFRAGAFGTGWTNLSYEVDDGGGTLNLMAINDADATWQTYSFNFIGTGSPTTLSFYSSGPGMNVDAVLDDVSVTAAVPEPATWALMVLGFGGLGYTMRRRPAVGTRIRFA